MFAFRDFLIQRADPTQGASLQAIVVAVMQEHGLVPDLSGTDADLLDIEQHYRCDGGEFFSVIHNRAVCGTMGLKNVGNGVAELRKMYLIPAARGIGLGRFMLQLAQEEARRLGFVRLQLETASILKDAIALYEQNGFTRHCGSSPVGQCDRIYSKTL